MFFEYDVLWRRIKRMQGTTKLGMSVVEEITVASEAEKCVPFPTARTDSGKS
jgi:purine nucleoside phosphorylase